MPIKLSKRPTITPQSAEWTPEEDEKLLELVNKFNGRWEKVSNGLNRTPFECNLRNLTLRQQKLRAKEEQEKEPKLMFPPSENCDAQSSRSASQLISKAHKEAVNSLSGIGSAQPGIVTVDNSALRATSEIDAVMINSARNILGSVFNISVDDTAIIKLSECDEKVLELSKERDQLLKQKDSAIQEAVSWRIELEKARDRAACLEAVVRGAEERVRNAEIAATLLEKQLLLANINALQAQVQRSIKHVECSDENLDKPSKRLRTSSSSEEGYQATLGNLTSIVD